jgi:tRNA1Val (adenine37-N6)-methyltransferase
MGRLPSRPFSARRFTVRHENCGMRVNHDGLLLGALAAEALRRRLPLLAATSSVRALDIGCGCGVVALLLRQAADGWGRPLRVTAIDIDSSSAAQAASNVEHSPWDDVRVQHSGLREFAAGEGRRAAFDLVVCNPPYCECAHTHAAAVTRVWLRQARAAAGPRVPAADPH